MKIGILGTRGIPNHYGGFEQFAEQVAVRWVQMGHEVTVYNSHNHPFQEKEYKGVQIVHCFDPENNIGTAGQFVYDLNCIMDSRRRKFDIFLQLGYTSSSIWSFLMPRRSKIVTNMDGLEWLRSKYSKKVQRFLKMAERWGVKGSHELVSDSIGIQDYLMREYKMPSTFIAYGADVVDDVGTDLLENYQLQPQAYHLIIARLEPENSIEIILDGYEQAKCDLPIVVVGNHQTHFGEYLKKKYLSNNQICFLGGTYDAKVVNQLRSNSNLYFHGHTVGGTNPSLIEAMGGGAFICAHRNVFNQSVLHQDACYFSNSNEVAQILQDGVSDDFRSKCKAANRGRVALEYNWNKIAEQYIALFQRCLI
jgi:glycosyltransferase involved in cell wall biosynthesis